MTPGRDVEDGDDRPGRRRWPIAAAFVAVIAAIGTTVLVRSGDESSPFEEAQALVADDDDGFDTGLEAGETLARAAQHLEAALEQCRRVERATTCQAISSALAYAQVLAPWVLECTAPGRHEARTRMAAYLEEVATVAPDARDVPDPPRLPSCRA